MARYNRGLLFIHPRSTTICLRYTRHQGWQPAFLLYSGLQSAINILLIGLITRVLCQCITVLRRKVYDRSRKREIFIFACRKCSS